MNLRAFKEEQDRLSQKIELVDRFDRKTIVAGCDVTFFHNKGIFSIVVMDIQKMCVVDKAMVILESEMNHYPEFSSYRNLPGLLKAYENLSITPDLLIVDGPGIMHPRKMGIASHLGLVLDIPTIGVSTKVTFGAEIAQDVYYDKEIIGKGIRTKPNAKPIYVSQGNRISLVTSLEIVKHCLVGAKLPKPLQEAHKLAAKEKQKLRLQQIAKKNKH